MIKAMQQTLNLKLNLIETSDPLSPAPLNENMDKLEAALDAVRAEAAAGDAALDSRITMLEAKHMVVGSYVGTGTASNHSQTIEIGFTPLMVLIKRAGISSSLGQSTVISDVILSDAHGELLKIVPGGIWVCKRINNSFNEQGTTYYYFAIG